TEKALEQIWQDVLRVNEPLSVTANFFHLGGHSLLATQLITKINTFFDFNMTIKAVFDHGTIAQMASQISTKGALTFSSYEPIKNNPDLLEGPLSFAQQRLWFLDQLNPGSVQYNMTQALRITGGLDVTALEQTINKVIERHKVLRSVYHRSKSGPVQVVLSDYHQAINYIRLSDEDEQKRLIEHHVKEELNTPFDLTQSHMLRSRLLSLSDAEHVLILTLHHIAADGWSLGILTEEICRLYENHKQGKKNALSALPIDYLDYAIWQHDREERIKEQLNYWLDNLNDVSPLSVLPTDYLRTSQRTHAGDYFASVLNAELTQSINLLCRDKEMTLFMVLEAALAVLISGYSAQDDIVIGTPVAGRLHQDVELLIGCFVNNLALRTQFSNDMSVSELMSNTRETVLNAYENQESPFEQIVDRLELPRSLDFSPLFQIQLIMQNTKQVAPELTELTLEAIPAPMNTVKYDLELNATEFEGEIHLGWQFSTELYDKSSIERFSRVFELILTSMMSDPQQTIGELQLIGSQDHKKVKEWNDTKRDYPTNMQVHHLFEQQVQANPAHTALIFGDEKYSYEELNVWANRLAQAIMNEGVRRGDVVGICMPRGAEQVAAVLAVLKAGAAYLPISLELPVDRIAYMCQDSEISLVLKSSHSTGLHTIGNAKWYCVSDKGLYRSYSEDNINLYDATSSDLAYVIYTSGSTGLPKGVLVEHQG
ncbi:non-ribosomal peptide synthetase, partial [Alteromonas sp. ASW11-130]|uniref:non-ribosomal peptide synthetase n=1 Tax=Alteromonas sp. ASW11-130 TaxID=3015775 RepID=UPI0022419ECB